MMASAAGHRHYHQSTQQCGGGGFAVSQSLGKPTSSSAASSGTSYIHIIAAPNAANGERYFSSEKGHSVTAGSIRTPHNRNLR